jgi:hypothetical protein
MPSAEKAEELTRRVQRADLMTMNQISDALVELAAARKLKRRAAPSSGKFRNL